VDTDFIEGTHEAMLVDAQLTNSRMEIMKSIQGDTDENSMLCLPWQRTLIAGDVVFNDCTFTPQRRT